MAPTGCQTMAIDSSLVRRRWHDPIMLGFTWKSPLLKFGVFLQKTFRQTVRRIASSSRAEALCFNRERLVLCFTQKPSVNLASRILGILAFSCIQPVQFIFSSFQMFSKYMARFFKIYGPPGTASEHAYDVWERQEGVNDDNVDITMGVTTWSPSGVDGDHAGYARIRPATQVGRRRVGGVSRGV